MYVFLTSFKKEHWPKKVLLLLYCKKILHPHTRLCYIIQIAFLNLFKSTFLSMKKKMSSKSQSWEKKAACLSVRKLIVYVFEFDVMNQLKSLFQIRWINKGRKDSCQEITSLTSVHTRFLISLRTPKLSTKKKSQNEGSVVSRSHTKNKLMWYFSHNKYQFSNVTENKPWLLSLWKAFHNSKRRLHFFSK